MATSIPFKYYRCETDEFVLPSGRVVLGSDIRMADRRREKRVQEIRDEMDAKSGYDPYNSINRDK